MKDVKTGEGTVNKQTGEVEWKVELKPQQVMELPLSYTLKYPKENQSVVYNYCSRKTAVKPGRYINKRKINRR